MDIIKKLDKTWPYTVIPVNFLWCSSGFWNPINTVRYGYGLSMISNGALTLLLNREQVSKNNLQSVCHAVLIMVYGARLSEFLYRRQSKPNYQAYRKEQKRSPANPPFLRKLRSVTMVTGVMSAYIIPLVYSFKYPAAEVKCEKKRWVSWVGCGMAAVGIILQFFADEQKLRYKENNGGCTMDGIYKYIRHPNYTGEALFHIGMWLGGFSGYKSRKDMFYSAIAPGGLTFVIVNASKRLDIKQMKKYGESLEYIGWRDGSWSLFPFIF